MKLCDRCRVSGCCLTYLGTACTNARARVCPEVQANNAELIHNMTLDELAAFLAAWAQETRAWKREFGEVRGWLSDEPKKNNTRFTESDILCAEYRTGLTRDEVLRILTEWDRGVGDVDDVLDAWEDANE